MGGVADVVYFVIVIAGFVCPIWKAEVVVLRNCS